MMQKRGQEAYRRIPRQEQPKAERRDEIKAPVIRCDDWRKRLRSDSLEMWFDKPEDLFGTPEQLTALGAAGIDLNDQTGKPTFAEAGFKTVVTPQGLLNGLVADSVVAGAGFEPATFGL